MFGRILIAIDGSSVSQEALEIAVHLAKDLHARARIVHVLDLGPLYETEASGIDVSGVERVMLQDGEAMLARATEVACRAGVPSETALLPIYDTHVAEAIVDDAKGWRAALIALGTHGRHGISLLFLGSVAEAVARTAPVPVLLARRAPNGRPSPRQTETLTP